MADATQIPMLTFVRMRRIEGWTDYDSPKPVFAEVVLDARERMQLVHIARLNDETLTEAEIFTAPFARFCNTNGLAEVPIEWWDVEDEEGHVRYQLWLYCADAGQLFVAATTTDAGDGQVIRCAFYGDGYEDGGEGTLAYELESAQSEAIAPGSDCELKYVAFVRRDT